jgi:molybdopterin/thiamine biosynthesis adenylyltransferase
MRLAVPTENQRRRGFAEIVEYMAAASLGKRPDVAVRMPQFVGYRGDAARGVRAGRFMVVGNGSIGRAVAMHFGRLQVAELRLVDPGRYDAENLLTQPIAPEDVGEPKAACTGRLVKRLSPATRVLAFDGPAEELDPSDYLDLSAVVLATDNLHVETDVGRMCHALGAPLIQAAVDGPTLVAQVRLWNNDDEQAACPACHFSPAEWIAMDAERSYRCGGPAAGQAETATRPTMSISPLCALAADVAVLRAVRLTLGLGKPEPDSLVEYCGFTHRTVTSPLAGNPSCRFDHRRWRTLAVDGPLGDYSAAALFHLADLDETAAGAGLSVSGAMFVERAVCLHCSARRRVRCFLHDSAEIPCLTCGASAVAEPFRSHRTVTVRRLGGTAGRPLAQLGIGTDGVAAAGGPRSVILHDGRESVLVYQSVTNLPRSPI